MPRVRFIKDFDWKIVGAKTLAFVAYKAGTVKSVTRLCASQAIAAGKAVPIDRRPAPSNVEGSDGEGS